MKVYNSLSKIDCSKCEHVAVCKYKDSIEESQEKMQLFLNENFSDALTSVHIWCQHHRT